jgi:hypothetical protein
VLLTTHAVLPDSDVTITWKNKRYRFRTRYCIETAGGYRVTASLIT